MACRHDQLRQLPIRKIGPEGVIRCRSSVRRGHRQNQWRTRIIVPGFNRIDMVPMAAFPAFEKKVDTCPAGPSVAVSHPRLTIKTAFGMWVQV